MPVAAQVHAPIREDWLRRTPEEALAPGIPIQRDDQDRRIRPARLRARLPPEGNDLPEDVRASLGEAFAASSEDKDLLTDLREQGSPVNIVLGNDYRALAEEQAEIVARIWEETPWR